MEKQTKALTFSHQMPFLFWIFSYLSNIYIVIFIGFIHLPMTHSGILCFHHYHVIVIPINQICRADEWSRDAEADYYSDSI